MKRFLGSVMCIIICLTTLASLTSCKKKEWWEDKENIIITIKLPGAQIEEISKNPFAKGDDKYFYFTHKYTGEKIDKKMKISVMHNGKEVGAYKSDGRDYIDPVDGWHPVRDVIYKGNYSIGYELYRTCEFNWDEKVIFFRIYILVN